MRFQVSVVKDKYLSSIEYLVSGIEHLNLQSKFCNLVYAPCYSSLGPTHVPAILSEIVLAKVLLPLADLFLVLRPGYVSSWIEHIDFLVIGWHVGLIPADHIAAVVVPDAIGILLEGDAPWFVGICQPGRWDLRPCPDCPGRFPFWGAIFPLTICLSS